MTDAQRASIERTIGVLASPTRRAILSRLEGRGETTRRALARELRPGGRAGGGPDPARDQALEASLHHVHLPKLDAAGLLEYDPDAGTARAKPRPEDVESLLECVRAAVTVA